MTSHTSRRTVLAQRASSTGVATPVTTKAARPARMTSRTLAHSTEVTAGLADDLRSSFRCAQRPARSIPRRRSERSASGTRARIRSKF
jgi:hypothetical protein